VRQLDADLRRFCARRLVRGALLLALLIIVASVTIGTARGKPATTKTGKSGTIYVGPGVDVGRAPNVTFPPDAGFDDTTLTFTTSDTRTNVGRDLKNVLEGTGIAMMFVAFVLGASFIGADYNVGSLTSQLLFEPRRRRVHLAKAAAVALGVGLLSLATSLSIAVAMYVGSELGGVVQGVDASFWWYRLGDTLRVAGAAAAAGAMAYAATVVTKRTSAGVIAFFVQFPLLFLISPSSKPFGLLSHYNPLRGLLAVITDPRGANPMFENGLRTMAGGVTLMTIWLVALVVLSGMIFARSEVR
jgi:hypothetical protein